MGELEIPFNTDLNNVFASIIIIIFSYFVNLNLNYKFVSLQPSPVAILDQIFAKFSLRSNCGLIFVVLCLGSGSGLVGC